MDTGKRRATPLEHPRKWASQVDACFPLTGLRLNFRKESAGNRWRKGARLWHTVGALEQDEVSEPKNKDRQGWDEILHP